MRLPNALDETFSQPPLLMLAQAWLWRMERGYAIAHILSVLQQYCCKHCWYGEAANRMVMHLVGDARVPNEGPRHERAAQPLAPGLDRVVQEEACLVEVIERLPEALVDRLRERAGRLVPHPPVAAVQGRLEQGVARR